MFEEKIESLNIILPTPPKPAGAYIPVVRTGNIAYVSGQIPIKEGKVAYKGKVPSNQSVEHAQEAAKLCVINALAHLKLELGNLEKISKILRVSGFVNSESDFTEQPKIINSASNLLFEIFGEKGQHSRIAIGVTSLPFDATVEIDMIVEIN